MQAVRHELNRCLDRVAVLVGRLILTLIPDRNTSADHLFNDLSVLEGENRWNGPDSICARCLMRVVDIDLDDLDAISIVGCETLNDGGNLATGGTPFGPKIYKYGRIGLQNFGLEVAIGYVENF